MFGLAHTGLTTPAVAGQVERAVRPHSFAAEAVAAPVVADLELVRRRGQQPVRHMRDRSLLRSGRHQLRAHSDRSRMRTSQPTVPMPSRRPCACGSDEPTGFPVPMADHRSRSGRSQRFDHLVPPDTQERSSRTPDSPSDRRATLRSARRCSPSAPWLQALLSRGMGDLREYHVVGSCAA